MIKTNIAIVGAGPAGSICAILLQRAGIDCVLIDRQTFPRDKLCGGGIPPHAWKLLRQLLPEFKYEYLPVDTIRFLIAGQYMNDYHMKQPMHVVKRKDFDNSLVEEFLRLGGRMIHETFVNITEQPDGLVLNMRSGEQVMCQKVVGADGSNSKVRRFLQPEFRADLLCLEQYEERKPGDEPVIVMDMSKEFVQGYYYEFPNLEINAVGYGDRETSMEKFRAQLKKHGHTEKKIRGAMITFSQNYPHHDRVILVGDAGGWVDDLTSEGIHYAIATGAHAAESIITGKPFDELNADIMRKKQHRQKYAKFVYFTPIGMFTMKNILRSKRLTEKFINRYMGCE